MFSLNNYDMVFSDVGWRLKFLQKRKSLNIDVQIEIFERYQVVF